MADPKEVLRAALEKQSFADKAKEAHEHGKEKPQSIPEKVGAFISESGKKILQEFEQGNTLKKIVILGGAVAAGYLTYKAIKALGSAIVDGFKKLFGLGEKLGEELEGARSSTIMSILKLALGGTLTVGTIATLYEVINGKIPFAEVLQVWNSEGMIGLGKLLLKKQKEGVISIGKDVWGAIAPALGLPALDTIKEQLAGVKQEVDKAYEWLDEKCNFSVVKIKMEDFFKKHNIEIPAWMQNLSLAEMAKDMGIDKNDLKTYAKYVGTGGAAILIYKWATAHGAKKGIMINAGVYLGIVNESTGEFGRELITALGSELDQAKKKLFEKWGKDSQIAEYLEDMFGDFSIEKHLESSLNWIKDHPAESMLAMNGMWLLRGIVIKGLKVGANAAWNAAKFTANNPGKAAIIGLGAAALYVGKKDFIDDFINLTYENPVGNEAKKMRENLDNIFGVDRAKKDTLAEKQVPAFAKALLEDPINALRLDKTIQKYFAEGKIAVGFDLLGKAFLWIEGTNVPVMLGKLTWESFKSLDLFTPNSEGNTMTTTTIVGVECVVFGSAAWILAKEQLRVIKTLYGAGDGGLKSMYNILSSTVPGTDAWKFTMRSLGSSLIMPYFKAKHGIYIGILEATMKDVEIDLGKTPMTKEILEGVEKKLEKLRNHGMFKEFSTIKTGLTGTRFGYEFHEKFNGVEKKITNLIGIVGEKDITRVQAMKSTIEGIHGKVGEYKGWASNVIERWELMKKMRILEAMKLRTPEELAEGAEKAAAKPLESETTFKKSHDTYKTNIELENEAKKLRTEIAALDPNDAARAMKQKSLTAIETYLSPLLATHPLDAKKVMETASTLEAREKGIKALFEKSIDDIVRDAKARGVPLSDPSIRAKLVEMDEKFLQPFAKQKKAIMKELFAEFKKMPANLQTKALRQQLNNALQGADGTLVTRIVKGVKGRAKFMAVMASMMFATDAIMHRNDPERELIDILESLGPDAGQLVLDCLPIAGTLSNFYSALAGKEAVSGRDVSGGWDRASNVAWGIVGLAGDAAAILAAPVSAGTSVGANALLRLTKAAKGGSVVAKKLITMWPRIETLVGKLGGWKKFSDKVATYLRTNKGKVAGTLRTVQKAGMITGGVLLAGGTTYHLFYNEVDKEEIDIPEGLTDTST